MYIRSDSTLKFLLLALHERATSEVVASAINDIIEHVGTTGPYRGGRQLLQLLEFGRREAEEAGDRASAAGLRDALGYARGTVLEPDQRRRAINADSAVSGQPSRSRSIASKSIRAVIRSSEFKVRLRLPRSISPIYVRLIPTRPIATWTSSQTWAAHQVGRIPPDPY